MQADIGNSEDAIAELRDDLTAQQEVLDEKARTVDQVKRTTSKASKALEQALKEIATMVLITCFSIDLTKLICDSRMMVLKSTL